MTLLFLLRPVAWVGVIKQGGDGWSLVWLAWNNFGFSNFQFFGVARPGVLES